MAKVIVTDKVTACDCCGKKNLKRAVQISHKSKTFLGVTCAGNRFDLNMSGNPFEAAKRLEFYINSLDKEDLENLISEIKDSNLNV